MGPPPKHPDRRARRGQSSALLTLPAEGRQGDPPPWPLPTPIDVAVLEAAVTRTEAEHEAAVTSRARAGAARRMMAARSRLAEAVAQAEYRQAAELELWAELWATPQAVQWEQMRCGRELAQYVRWKVFAEGGHLKAGAEARQLADRLGLTPMALLRLRWEVVADTQDGASTPARATEDVRARYATLRAVAPRKARELTIRQEQQR